MTAYTLSIGDEAFEVRSVYPAGDFCYEVKIGRSDVTARVWIVQAADTDHLAQAVREAHAESAWLSAEFGGKVAPVRIYEKMTTDAHFRCIDAAASAQALPPIAVTDALLTRAERGAR